MSTSLLSKARRLQAENRKLRTALRPFALYADQNDLKERDPRGAIEVPIPDLVRALRAYGPNVHDDVQETRL